MAEAAMFSLASKLLTTIVSPEFKKAYERICAIWDARDDLDKLQNTIQTIQAVLLDAEKKEENSATVKVWIKRIRDVFYEADDLFDEVATSDLLAQTQQIKGNYLLKKVRVCSSPLNRIVSNYSIAKRVKAVRRSLLGLSTDMAAFGFVKCQYEEPIFSVRKGQDPGSFVDPKVVFGRDGDKKAILDVLLEKSNARQIHVPVIAIVGIGGMGKTTLAQLIYNDEEVQKNFEKRWFACISDVYDEKEVIGKIFQSMYGETYSDFTLSQLQFKVRQSITCSKNFLLVLDDVWDDDYGRWLNRMSLLNCGVRGSKIIVTTRSLSVARALDPLRTHNLAGLSDNEAWSLFKRLAYTAEQEKDPKWTCLGKKIVKKCPNVPLAIKSVASILYTRTTIQEWELFKDEELSKLDQSDDAVMPSLKLSYDHLPSILKHCFAYCSLFPKDWVIDKQKLIYLWIAQGYIKPNNSKQTVEEVGHAYFMELLRRSFFQETKEDEYGDIKSCKMHDLVHDLAQHVAGEESVLLTMETDQLNNITRHVSVGYAKDDPCEILPSLLNVKRLRSFLFMTGHLSSQLAANQQYTTLKFLCALGLHNMKIKIVPSTIGELQHLRYLDLSSNDFISLPASITKLINLQMLDISFCEHIQSLPNDFKKLTSLRKLVIHMCRRLRHMPPRFGELASLQHLSHFHVSESSSLEALARLKLKGKLSIQFEDDVDCWGKDQCHLELPETLQQLDVAWYLGVRIPPWAAKMAENPPCLVNLTLRFCLKVKHLPSLRHLPHLKSLYLLELRELEYIEEEAIVGSNAAYFPSLEKLELCRLLNLKGWSREAGEAVRITDNKKHSTSPLHLFAVLSDLTIVNCPELESMPLSPHIQRLRFHIAYSAEVLQHLLSACSSSLQDISIYSCSELLSFPGEATTSLKYLEIGYCDKLKILHTPPPHLNILERLKLLDCRELELWEEEKRGVDWDSLSNLRILSIDTVPFPEKLPDCLRQRQVLGELEIRER